MRRWDRTGFGGEEPKAHGGWALGRETWQLHCDGPQAPGEKAICSADPPCLVPRINKASGVPNGESKLIFSGRGFYLEIRPILAPLQTTESSASHSPRRL